MSDEQMFFASGYWWPTGIKPTAVPHALRRAKTLQSVWPHIPRHRRRLAVQAGGMIGLYPLAMSQVFQRVVTFEPQVETFACLHRNTHHVGNIQRWNAALGDGSLDECGINRKSVGSHTVREDGHGTEIVTIDEFISGDCLDFLQLDLEGYEAKAVRGAIKSIKRFRPIIQLEWIGFTEHYGDSQDELMALLTGLGYQKVADIKGGDILLKHESDL